MILRIRGMDNLIRELQKLPKLVYAQIKSVVAKEVKDSPRRIKQFSFSSITTPTQLRVRSGLTRAAMGFTHKQITPLSDSWQVGATKGGPKVQIQLHTHEAISKKYSAGGSTRLRPTHGGDKPGFGASGGKLAFPPGNGGFPGRDANGSQILTAAQFKVTYKALGYAHVRATPNAIIARRQGARNFELIFIRRASVKIKARYPITQDIPRTTEAIDKAIAALPDL